MCALLCRILLDMVLVPHTAHTQASVSPNRPYYYVIHRKQYTYALSWNCIDILLGCSTSHIGSRMMLRTNSASAQSVFVSLCSASNLSITMSTASSVMAFPHFGHHFVFSVECLPHSLCCHPSCSPANRSSSHSPLHTFSSCSLVMGRREFIAITKTSDDGIVECPKPKLRHSSYSLNASSLVILIVESSFTRIVDISFRKYPESHICLRLGEESSPC